MLYDEEANWKGMRLALDSLPEYRDNAALRHEIYHLKMIRAYNRRVHEWPPKSGGLCVTKNGGNQ